jgi:hypothetical protein
MTPRLLTERAAAAYLSLPVAAMKRLQAGRVTLDGKVRWDRRALDEWLDALRGARPQSANQNASGPDAALAQFLADTQDASRRP